MNYTVVYWSVGVLVTLLSLVSLYYFSCHCTPPTLK